MTNKKTIDWYAESYTKNFGFHLVPIEGARKYPRVRDWGKTTLSSPELAGEFYRNNPTYNMGVALGPSRLCSVDIDCFESFSLICEAFGIDLDALIKETPTIQGKAPGSRLMFRVPDGMQLGYHKLNWRPESDPEGNKHRELIAAAKEARDNGDTERASELRDEARQYAMYAVFELRSATDGHQRLDVFPPSMHPDTGKPYRWISQPRDPWPELPVWLATIWLEFDKIKPQMMAACPWLPVPKEYKPKRRRTPEYAPGGTSVIDQYCRSTDIVSELTARGYEQRGKRFISPHSTTNLPGVVLFDDDRCWIHHASDPLCSDETGQPVNAFDLYCFYEHGGDIRKAVKQAAADLGMPPQTGPREHAPLAPPVDEYIDPETGEVLPATPADVPDAVNRMLPLPWTSRSGKPYSHIENLKEITRRLGVTIRYNVIKKQEEILVPGVSFSMDNEASASLAWLESECSLFDYPTSNMGGFITFLADKNQYNPVAAWIKSRPWDGKSRFFDLCDTVTTEQSDYIKTLYIKKWMISAVAAAFSPNGVVARGVLTFQGAQEIGKTRWFKRLADPDLDVVSEGVILKPDDKDSVKSAVSNWLVELGEVDATFRRSDIAQLKGFLTKQVDVLRLPYAKRDSHFPRRTVFFASVNPREFLNDPTGSNRFWTLACKSIDHNHDIDMQQVWSEVYEFYLNGESHYFGKEDIALLNESNESYDAIDPVAERIDESLDWDSDPSGWRWEQVTTVLLDCGIDRPTRADTMKASEHIRKRNGGQGKRTKTQRLVLVPRKKPDSYGDFNF